jgi:hypothetical protein
LLIDERRGPCDPACVKRADARCLVGADRRRYRLDRGVLDVLALDVDELRPCVAAIVWRAVVAHAPQPPAADLAVLAVGSPEQRGGAIAQGDPGLVVGAPVELKQFAGLAGAKLGEGRGGLLARPEVTTVDSAQSVPPWDRSRGPTAPPRRATA